MTDQMRLKRLPVNLEMLSALMKGQNTVQIDSPVPDSSFLKGVYTDQSHWSTYFMFVNEEWPEIREGDVIPMLDRPVEFELISTPQHAGIHPSLTPPPKAQFGMGYFIDVGDLPTEVVNEALNDLQQKLMSDPRFAPSGRMVNIRWQQMMED